MDSVAMRARRLVRRACCAVAALLLTACTTPYQPRGAMGGFSERQIAPDRFAVEFQGNGNSPALLVGNMYLYRCAELTVQHGFDVFRSMHPDEPAASSWSMPLAQMAGDDAQPTEFRGTGGVRYVPVYVRGSPVTMHRVSGVVHMGRLAGIPSDVRVWDARAVLKVLEPVVRGTGAQPLPAERLARVAVVTGRGQPAVSAAGTSLDDLRRLLKP